MKSLVIAEKPSVARDIARVLKCGQKSKNALEGERYIVTWGLGHLVTLASPEVYDQRYKEWNLAYLPMIPKKMKLEVIKQTSGQYHAVKKLLFRKDVKDIIIATDAGREGELVARWILEKAECQKPIQRLWISSVTDRAIREGFQNLKPGNQYDSLYYAAAARAEADWLVGLNATRALTGKYNASLSCGRVQTPTLAMIAAREQEIRSFKSVPYYGLMAISDGITFTWRDKKSRSTRSFDKVKMEQIKERCFGSSLKIEQLQKKTKNVLAPPLYDLTELQRDANRKFGFSAKETLNIMQRLYENHKVLTYPRTDSRYLTKDILPTIKERLKACQTGPYKQLAAKCMKVPLQGNMPFINDKKVSDHHAIIPTEQYVQLTNMTNEERKIYDLVVRRFFAVLLPPCSYEQTSVSASIGELEFIAGGKSMIASGWQEAYEQYQEEDSNDDEVENQNLPRLLVDQVFKIHNLKLTEGKTKPPAYFNEATLLSAMENPTKFMDQSDNKAKQTLIQTGGLGTVATRADIIEKLFNSFLIEKTGNDIHTTAKARQLLELVPEELRQPKLTADWEDKLQKIAKGGMRSTVFMSEIRDYTRSITEEIKCAEGKFRHDNQTNKPCPRCGKKLLSVNGKNSKMLVCQDRECGYRQTISRTSNARCPVCHKRMELYGVGEDASFICVCGHKEKMAKFQERRKKEGAGVSKQDVSNYIKKQKKEADQPLNNAFADAFKNLKL